MSGNGTVAELDVVFRGRFEQLETAMKEAKAKVQSFGAEAQSAAAQAVAGASGKVSNEAEKSAQSIKLSFSKLGSGLSSFGRQMSTYVSAPMAAIALGAAKLSMDFGDAMAKIEGLANVSHQVAQNWRSSIFAISEQTGRGPKELADAMYFIASAGLKGADAVNVLRMSAQGAMVGLGETKTVADAVTSAINAYGKGNLTAAQATDIMVATVRDGKVAADSVAGALGRVLPVAAQMGVSFANVGAAVASMTRMGLNADEATTALRQTMVTLLHPTRMTQEALASVGLTAAGLRVEMQQNLIGALSHLSAAFRGNDEAMSRVFPNVRALTGVLNLTGRQASSVAKIFGDVANSSGSLAKAVGVAAQTTGQQWREASAAVQVAGVKFGDALAPQIRRVADEVKGLADWYSKLTPLQQSIIADVVKWTAILGPLIFAIGKVITLVTAVSKGIGTMRLALAALNVQSVITTSANSAVALSIKTIGLTATASLGPVRALIVTLGALAVAAAAIFAAYKAGTAVAGALQEETDAATKAASWDVGRPTNPAEMRAEWMQRHPGQKFDESNPFYQKVKQKWSDWGHQKLGISAPGSGVGPTDALSMMTGAAGIPGVGSGLFNGISGAMQSAQDIAALGATSIGSNRAAGSTKKLSDAAKEAKKNLQAYRDEVTSLNLALHEVGLTTDWEQAIAERKYGKYKSYTAAEWEHVYALISHKEHLEDLLKAQQDQAAKAAQIASDQRQAAIDTDTALRDYLTTQKQELDMVGVTTSLQKAQYEVTKGSAKDASVWYKAQALAIGAMIDKKKQEMELDKEIAAADKSDNSNFGFANAIAKMEEFAAKEKQTEQQAFDKYMKSINDQLREMNGLTEEETVKNSLMGQAFSKNAKLMQQAIQATLKLDQLKRWQASVSQAATSMTDIFMQSLGHLATGGFGGFFKSILSGFDNTISQMGLAWARSWINQQLTHILGGAIPGGGGGSGSGIWNELGSVVGALPHFAAGGSISASTPSIIGEMGPELFIPSSGGTIIPNNQLSSAGGGGASVVVNMNITTPNPGAFRASNNQIASDLATAIQRAVNRN